MRKLTMPKERKQNFFEVFALFQLHQTAKDLAETTLKNYKHNARTFMNGDQIDLSAGNAVAFDPYTHGY